jgi:hypothetical protein
MPSAEKRRSLSHGSTAVTRIVGPLGPTQRYCPPGMPSAEKRRSLSHGSTAVTRIVGPWAAAVGLTAMTSTEERLCATAVGPHQRDAGVLLDFQLVGGDITRRDGRTGSSRQENL